MFALLVWAHFAADFVWQTHYEAMRKHADWKARALHCSVYTTCMVAALLILGVRDRLLLSAGVLWISHFVEDTYIPVYLWAKYIRRVPEAQTKDGFVEWVKTPLGKILMIAVDQIIHIGFLIPVTYWSTHN